MKAEKLTAEQIDAKAAELSQKHSIKVHPLVFQLGEDSEQIVGYIKEPSRLVKMRALDKLNTSLSSAGEDILSLCLIKEDSDPRIYSESEDCTKIYIGACMAAAGLVEVAANIYKKK